MGNKKIKSKLAFAGYGISAPDLKYDDYAEQDLAGKIVVIIRREPQQDDEKSVFNGKQNSPHAYIRSKVQAAKKQKAAAILMVNDPFTTAQEKKDTLTASARSWPTGCWQPLPSSRATTSSPRWRPSATRSTRRWLRSRSR